MFNRLYKLKVNLLNKIFFPILFITEPATKYPDMETADMIIVFWYTEGEKFCNKILEL